MRDPDIAGHDPAEGARQEQPCQGVRLGEPEIGEAGTERGREQHRLAPDAVADAAPDRREGELGGRVARRDEGDRSRARAEGLGVERLEREDDPEADQVDENDEEQCWHGIPEAASR